MSETETRTRFDEPLYQRRSRGCTFLTEGEANLLRRRSKARHKSVSRTIQELVQPVIDRFENSSTEVREIMLQGYTEQNVKNMETGLKTFEESRSPAFVLIYWVLPKTFTDRLGDMAAKGRLSNESLMSSILMQAIHMGDNN